MRWKLPITPRGEFWGNKMRSTLITLDRICEDQEKRRKGKIPLNDKANNKNIGFVSPREGLKRKEVDEKKLDTLMPDNGSCTYSV